MSENIVHGRARLAVNDLFVAVLRSGDFGQSKNAQDSVEVLKDYIRQQEAKDRGVPSCDYDRLFFKSAKYGWQPLCSVFSKYFANCGDFTIHGEVEADELAWKSFVELSTDGMPISLELRLAYNLLMTPYSAYTRSWKIDKTTGKAIAHLEFTKTGQ